MQALHAQRWSVQPPSCFLLVKSVHLFSLQLSAALHGGWPAPLVRHQVWGVSLGELQAVTLHRGWT